MLDEILEVVIINVDCFKVGGLAFESEANEERWLTVAPFWR